MPAPKTEAPASAVGAGALSALLHDLVRGADPGSSWERVLRPGAVIGRFELVRELGRGGFGVVYEARDRELGRPVALKAVRAGDRLDLREERLLREAEVAARLSHPNLVTLFDVGHCEHGPYLVLELLRGETLAQRLEQGPIPVREALRVGAAIARGLSHAHAEGVIHRDLTPGNVFLCQDGQVKVLDLGLAHAFGRRRVDGGTPGYMAPEQRRGAPEDERTDVFALGAILHRMLAGEPPFQDGQRRSRGPAPALDVPEVPALGPLVERMLALDPVARPRDAGEVAAALDAFERELRSASGDVAAPVVQRRPRRGHWLGVGAAGVLLGLAVAGGVILRARRPEGNPPGPGAARAEASIAVLPFQDMSPGRDQEYLADGIAEEILNALAQVEGLRVIGRTSSFSFKGKGEDLATIARKLGVARLLEGSLRREGSRVRVSAQLVDAAGHELWAERFDRELSGIFALQDEIAAAVVEALRVKLLPGEAPSTKARGTSSLDAYREFLLGRQFADQGTHESYRRAIAAFERAVAADPTYGPAWAALASARSWYAGTEAGLDAAAIAAAVGRSMDEAERAVAVSPRLADGYAVRGFLRGFHVPPDWNGAEADLRHALEVSPRDPVTLQNYGFLLGMRGRLDEGIAALRRSTDVEPLSAMAWFELGVLYSAKDLTLARAALERALEIAPDAYLPASELSLVLALQGEGARARAAAERVGDEAFRLAAVAIAEHVLGHAAESQRALDEVTRRAATTAAYQIAEVHAFRGDRAQAIRWLERAWDQRDGGLLELSFDPLLRSVRDEPRFRALLKKMGLTTG